MTALASPALVWLESLFPYLEGQIHSDVSASAHIVKQFHYPLHLETSRQEGDSC